MSKYEFAAVEKKWRAKWEATPVQQNVESKPKYYCLDMFPYPSGTALHVGHWRGYVLTDVLSRYKILQGYHVLHPMGWDAFGLAAENNAIKRKMHPAISTTENIASMKRQLKEMSTIYDWNYEINTTDPAYYKWTQWIFARMFEKGLAYEKEMPLNWCQACKIVLANEEATGGVCERCGNPATKKNLRQWMLKITEYAERLLNDLDGLNWPEKVKRMQSEWIGKSNGAEIDFEVVGGATLEAAAPLPEGSVGGIHSHRSGGVYTDEVGDAKHRATRPVSAAYERAWGSAPLKLRAYTTRPDTLFGATFMVLAPEHELVSQITTPEQLPAVEEYVKQASSRSSVDRMASKEKTGVFTGRYAINPMTGRGDMPIWVADYVLADYGTGLIMCVPGHDERDFEFAKKFDLPITEVISQSGTALAESLEQPYIGDGVLVNSGEFNRLSVSAGKEAITKALENMGAGKQTINYKLRDWVFSRQRYWGEPIPIIHCECCGPVLVPDSDLPVELPNVESYHPTDTGESPLALVDEWVNVPCPKCSKPAKRETNTMPQWAGSSWYFLRYPDVHNEKALASPEALKKWLPVDYYVGGIEHAVLHLLYARFYTKFLYDIGAVGFEEPFTTLFNIGMVNYKGKKMSKGEGYGVSPDEVLPKYGCDALRLYEMFISPPEMDCEWDDSGIDGVFRFLNKVWRIVEPELAKIQSKNSVPVPEGSVDGLCPAERRGLGQSPIEMERLRHRMIYDITTRLEKLSLNTVVSGFMEHTNTLQDLAKQAGGVDKATIETLAILLSPFAPHMAEEIWEQLGNSTTVFAQTWPKWDDAMLKSDTIEIALQVNGKFRGNMVIAADLDKDSILEQAKAELADKLAGVEIVKSIYVPGRIVNFVVK